MITPTKARIEEASMAIHDEDPQDLPTALLDWQVALASKWQALGREVLGLHEGPRRRLSELGRACLALAVAAAWFESQGNITHAAARLRTNRKTFREHTLAWRRENPQLVPPPDPFLRSRHRRRHACKPKDSPP